MNNRMRSLRTGYRKQLALQGRDYRFPNNNT